MNRKQLFTLILMHGAALAGASGPAVAGETQSRETQFREARSDETRSQEKQFRETRSANEQVDLREEIASPLAGEFVPSGDTFRSGWQQDFGGMSGNANGMDGFPTASGESSAYPAPGGPSSQNGAP